MEAGRSCIAGCNISLPVRLHRPGRQRCADWPVQEPKAMSHARYLGNAVYASFDGYHVALTTDSHIPAEAGNLIYLEPEVIEAFQKYLAALKKSLEAGETRGQL